MKKKNPEHYGRNHEGELDILEEMDERPDFCSYCTKNCKATDMVLIFQLFENGENTQILMEKSSGILSLPSRMLYEMKNCICLEHIPNPYKEAREDLSLFNTILLFTPSANGIQAECNEHWVYLREAIDYIPLTAVYRMLNQFDFLADLINPEVLKKKTL